MALKKVELAFVEKRDKKLESLWEQNGLVHMVAIEISGNSVTKCSALCATRNNYHAFKHWNTIIATEPVKRLTTRLDAGFQSQNQKLYHLITGSALCLSIAL